MNFSGIKTYLKFLSRNKVYTFVSVAGFSISMMFVMVLLLYARTQGSMDDFHDKKYRIYMLSNGEHSGFSNPVGPYIQDLCPEIETFTRIINRPFSIGLNQKEWFEGRAMFADRDFFNIFSFPLIAGDPDNVLLTDNSAVLSRSTALRLFGGEDPIGRTVFVSDIELSVTGIMEDFPYNTHFEAPDIVVAYPMTREYYGFSTILEHWGSSNFRIYFLARENTDPNTKTGIIIDAFMKDYWLYQGGFADRLEFMPLEEVYYHGGGGYDLDVKRGNAGATRIYIAIALLVLVIALMNYVNMTVAQAGFRGKEAAVKKLLGSGRTRIVRQLLTESLIMTSVALVLAVFLALLCEPLFNTMLGTRLEITDNLSLFNILVVLISIAAISVLAGIIPALAVSSFKPLEVVKGTFRRKVRTSYSRVLIVFQFTVCIALLACTFVMRSQTEYMTTYDLGFNKENILLLENTMDTDEMPALKDRLMQVPGVENIGYLMWSPIDPNNNSFIAGNGETVGMNVIVGDSVFVDIFGLEITPTMASGYGPDVTVVYVNRLGYNAVQPDSISFRFEGWRDNAVVGGVLNDINVKSLRNGAEPTMFYYMPEDEWPWEIVVKLASDNIYETAAAVRNAYMEMNDGEYFEWYFADDRLMSWYDEERRMSGVMGAFTLLSIVIMVMGVFAMSLYMIRQKEKEIGIRKVSGATVGEVLGMLNLQSLGRVAAAFVLACPLAWYVMYRWLQDFAYSISPGIWPFVYAGLIVTVLCLLSVSWQTLQAARANPVESLKSE